MALLPNRSVARIVAGVVGGALLVGVAWLGADWFNERQKAVRTDAYVQGIITMLRLENVADFHDRIDKVRTFINDNSIHKIDRAFWANHGDSAAYAAGVLAHAKGTASEPVHMECSTRTNLMALIFGKLGYETRVVAIFNSRTNLQSHTFLDVLNPETERWETQDADYDIYWRSKVSGDRVSAADAAEAINEIEPCGRASCGGNHESREGIKAQKLADYLDIVSITEKGFRYALYTSRANLNRVYSKGSKQGRFCEVEAKRCKDGFSAYTLKAAGPSP